MFVLPLKVVQSNKVVQIRRYGEAYFHFRKPRWSQVIFFIIYQLFY